jgi:protein-S-isoprenylcysteine O-methyltransferase Ste14
MIKSLVVQMAVWFVVMAAVLFGSADTVQWAAGWWFLLEWAVLGFWLGVWLARHDPALLAERLKPVVQRQQSGWDRVFMVYIGVMWFAWLILMGLDAGRFHWTSMPGWLGIVGALAIFLCIYLCRAVFRANSFAAPVVKIQAERGHRVSDTGPYAYVRHPMYAAALLFFVGLPLLLGSGWGFAGVPLLVVGMGYRAVREERLLAAELDGYADYAARVRYRFVPYLW